MKIEGAAALVTGANRGLGAAIAQALVDSGAKVYGAARDDTTITNPDVIPVRLDVNSPDDIAFVDGIPHTATGKILKTALRDQFKEYTLPTAVAAAE